MQIMNNGFIMIHHGPMRQPKNRAKGGVATIIVKEFDKGWRKTGNKTRLRGMLEFM